MIYFIGCNDQYVKIGVSEHLQGRLDSLQTGNPYDLRILKAVDVSDEAEVYLHNKFSHLHHRREWFCLNPELKEYIATEVEKDLCQFQQKLEYSKAKHPILFIPKQARGRIAIGEGFSLNAGRIYSVEGIARICVLCDLNPKDFFIWHDGVYYEDFDNDIYTAEKKRVERILQND